MKLKILWQIYGNFSYCYDVFIPRGDKSKCVFIMGKGKIEKDGKISAITIILNLKWHQHGNV